MKLPWARLEDRIVEHAANDDKRFMEILESQQTQHTDNLKTLGEIKTAVSPETLAPAIKAVYRTARWKAMVKAGGIMVATLMLLGTMWPVIERLTGLTVSYMGASVAAGPMQKTHELSPTVQPKID